MIFTIINRRKDKNFVELNPVHKNDASIYAAKAAKGKTFPQMASFVCTIILCLIPIIIGLGIAITTLTNSSSSESLNVISGVIIITAFLLIVMTPLTAIINSFWIYPKKLRLAEAYAFENKTATKLLKVQRRSAWVIWIFYTVVGAFLVYAVYGFGGWF
jgi:hypothetical protein